jgi:hypothetical protein
MSLNIFTKNGLFVSNVADEISFFCYKLKVKWRIVNFCNDFCKNFFPFLNFCRPFLQKNERISQKAKEFRKQFYKNATTLFQPHNVNDPFKSHTGLVPKRPHPTWSPTVPYVVPSCLYGPLSICVVPTLSLNGSNSPPGPYLVPTGPLSGIDWSFCASTWRYLIMKQLRRCGRCVT